MNKKVLILAGWGGSDFPHWQSWLASEIVKDYGKVSFLSFSNFFLMLGNLSFSVGLFFPLL